MRRRLRDRYGRGKNREAIRRNHRGWTIEVFRSMDGVSWIPRIYKGRRLVETFAPVKSKLGGLQVGARAIDREIGD